MYAASILVVRVQARLEGGIESEPGLCLPFCFIPEPSFANPMGAVVGNDLRINVAAHFEKAPLRESLRVNRDPDSRNAHNQQPPHWRKFSRVKSPLFIGRLYFTFARVSRVRLFLVKSSTATVSAVQIPSIDSTSR